MSISCNAEQFFFDLLRFFMNIDSLKIIQSFHLAPYYLDQLFSYLFKRIFRYSSLDKENFFQIIEAFIIREIFSVAFVSLLILPLIE